MKRLLTLILVVGFCLVSTNAYAEQLKLKIPDDLSKGEDKIAYCYQAGEKLRVLYNEYGRKYTNGAITKKEWEEWKNDFYTPRDYAIADRILECRNLIKAESTFEIDLEEVFE